MSVIGYLFRFAIGNILVACFSALKWTFDVLACASGALRDVTDEWLQTVRMPQGSPQRLQPTKVSAKPQPALRIVPVAPQEPLAAPRSQLVPEAVQKPNTPQAKKATLLADGWTVVSDSKKDGIAMLHSKHGEEMLVNTRTWDPIYQGPVKQAN